MARESAKDKLKALSAEAEGEKRSRIDWIPGWIKAALPYACTAGVVVYLYFALREKITGEDVWDEVLSADMLLFTVARSAIFLGFLFADSFVFSKIFTWFYRPIKFSELWPMRGYTMMYTILHPAIGQGWWLAFLVRKSGQSLRTVFGVSLITGITILFLSIGVLAYLLYSVHTGIIEFEYLWLLWIVTIGLVLWVFHIVTYFVFKWKWGFMERFRDGPIFSVLGKAGVKHYAIVFAVRSIQLVIIITSEYYCAVAFNIEISFMEFVTRFPIVLLYLLIPSVGHFGPLQMGWLAAYGAFGTEAAILACTVMQTFVGHLIKVAIGLISFIPAGKYAKSIRLHDDEPGPEVGEEISITSSE